MQHVLVEKKPTARQDRMLKRLAIENRRKTLRQLFFQLHQEADVAIFCSTVRRRLHESELHSRRPRKKPLLTDEHRWLKQEWVAMYYDWDVEAWTSVLFSDEAEIAYQQMSLAEESKKFVVITFTKTTETFSPVGFVII